ncbi:UDP-N-acetylmuramoyl-L-alanine--D-glutamate ligase [Patescibacteria group bacterium]|nr:UDP-N-acetylmuramoyl-L-alanine--D-glutamate ligase [Patescibacteria group bacterium]
MIQIKNKKILLLGLGLHGGGVATARWLYKNGAKLIISDLRKQNVLRPSLKSLTSLKAVKYVLGKHREQDVKWADIIIYNPGVPKESKYLQLARRLNKPVYNEASLFFDRCQALIIAVTGTRGKSTTAALIARMCEQKNPRTILAGNIKTSFMLDVVDRATKNDLIVLELSSWQLEGLNIVRGAPHIAVVTNLYPDHLNRYRNLTHYYCSKKEIFKHQKENHFIVLNNENKVARDWQKEACSRTLLFSKKDHKALGAFVKAGKIMFRSDERDESIMSVRDIALQGEHNLENVLAATAVAKIYGLRNSNIKKALKSPLALEGRQEVAGNVRGVLYVNDTTSTTPDAGIAALDRFGKNKRIILIAGGADKKLEYDKWARAVKRACKSVYLLTGDASKKMKRSLCGMRNLSDEHNDLGVLVRKISEHAKRGDIVLLSPAAASFNLWNHEFERGDDFVKAVKRL